jgi:hypothetical protein
MEGSKKHDFSAYVERSFYKGLQDGVLTTLGLSGLSVAASRYSPFYRGFSTPGKVFFVLMGGIAATIISAEHSMVNTYYRVKQTQSPSVSQPAHDAPFSASQFISDHQFAISSKPSGLYVSTYLILSQ